MNFAKSERRAIRKDIFEDSFEDKQVVSCACIALPSLDGEDSRVVRNVFDPHHLVKDVGHLLLGVISRRIDSGPLVVL